MIQSLSPIDPYRYVGHNSRIFIQVQSKLKDGIPLKPEHLNRIGDVSRRAIWVYEDLPTKGTLSRQGIDLIIQILLNHPNGLDGKKIKQQMLRD